MRSSPRTPSAVQHQKHAEGDALARLLAAESRLAERLATAREAAEETLRSAREDAARIEASCEAVIRERTTELTAQYQSRIECEIADLADNARSAAARFENVDETQLAALASFVIERLLTTFSDEEPP